MAVPVTTKLRAISRDLGGQARLARALGVSPSRVSRWLHAERPDPENRRKVDALEFVLARLLSIYHRETALKWLDANNPHLGDHRPIDRLSEGRVDDVLAALSIEESGSYA